MGIIEMITAFFKAIPVIGGWIPKKTELEKEQADKTAVDQEHNANAKSGKPSSDFWRGKGV